MRKVEELLMNRQFYLKKIIDASSSVIHNHNTRRQLRYYNKAIKMLEERIQEELDNESK